MTKWTFSSIKDFEQCARKFHEVRVLRNYRKLDTEQNLYGGELHSQAEHAVMEGRPLDPSFKFLTPVMKAITDMEGTKFCEMKLAVRQDLSACEFDDPEYWCRGIADLIIISPDQTKARGFDYKSGNDRYADTDQLLLMALMLFAHYPTVQSVSSGLLFVLKGTVAKHRVQRDQAEKLWWRWRERVARLEAAHANGYWPPKKSGLCKKYCPVVHCEHHGA